MRNFISCVIVVVIIILSSLVSGCNADSKNVKDNDSKTLVKERSHQVRKAVTAAQIRSKIEQKMEEELSVSMNRINMRKIEGVCDFYNKEKGVISTLPDRNEVSMKDLDRRLCRKIRDFAHFKLNKDRFDGKAVESLEKMEKLIDKCGTCSGELAEIKKWKSFYARCISDNNCFGSADFEIEIVNGRKDLPWYKKMFSSEKWSVRLETRDKDRNFKVLRNLELEKRGVIQTKIKNTKIKEKYKFNATII